MVKLFSLQTCYMSLCCLCLSFQLKGTYDTSAVPNTVSATLSPCSSLHSLSLPWLVKKSRLTLSLPQRNQIMIPQKHPPPNQTHTRSTTKTSQKSVKFMQKQVCCHYSMTQTTMLPLLPCFLPTHPNRHPPIISHSKLQNPIQSIHARQLMPQPASN